MQVPLDTLDSLACNEAMDSPAGSIEVWEEALRAGDETALAHLFDQHHQRLARLVRFRMSEALRARLDVEDVLQEAYLAAAKRVDRFGHDGFESSFLWLRLIVLQRLVELHRHHLQAQRRDARREVAIHRQAYPEATSVSLVTCLAGTNTSPSGVAVRNEMTERVRAAIENLPELDQEVLALRHFEELTNSETAGILGIEPKAASMRYIRALERLKEQMGNRIAGAGGGGRD